VLLQTEDNYHSFLSNLAVRAMSPSDNLSNLKEIEEQIRELESFDLKTVEEEVVYRKIRQLMPSYGGRPVSINTSKRVYRVRRNLSERLHSSRDLEWYLPLFGEVRLIWYPPKEEVRTRGRINNSGESVFYCATSINTAVLEMRPEHSEYLTILECAFVNEALKPNIFEAGIHEGPGVANPNYGATPPEHDAQYQRYLREQGITEETQLIRGFLLKQFTRAVEPGSEHDYRISNAIAAVLLNEFGFITESDHVPVDVEADGIAYASIAAERLDANIAFTCAAADRLLQPVACGVFIFEKEDDRPKPEIRRTHKAKSITNDGKIIW
jgi:hypothetical protein